MKHPKARESEKFKRFPLETLLARDKVNLDIFWLKDNTLDDPDLLPPTGRSCGRDRGESADGA